MATPHCYTVTTTTYTTSTVPPTDAVGGKADTPQPPRPMYVMFTSGTTGAPRAVLGSCRATLARLQWMWTTYPWANDDVLLSRCPLAFVDCWWELLGGLLAGVPTVLCTDAQVHDFASQAALIRRCRVTRVTALPAVLEALVGCVTCGSDADGAGAPVALPVRVVVSSGGPLHWAVARRLQAVMPHATLLNLYGSTETTGDCFVFDVSTALQSWGGAAVAVECSGTVPIGRPLPGSSCARHTRAVLCHTKLHCGTSCYVAQHSALPCHATLRDASFTVTPHD